MFRLIRSLHPVLIVALFGGAVLFAPATKSQPTADAPQQENKPAEDESANLQSGQSADLPIDQSAPSLLAQIFGATAVDPLFKLPGSDSPPGTAPTQSGTQEPQTEPARSIYRYLVASSEIGFQSDQSRLGIALSTADNGDTTTLDRLIAELEAQFTTFQALTPPQELRDVHDASIRIVLRYINLLKAARSREQGSAKATWQSPERTAIAEEAERITQKIRDVVRAYGIALPQGVLP